MTDRKVINLFGNASDDESMPEFPTSAEEISEHIKRMNYVYFANMVDTNLDLFADQMLACNMIKRSLGSKEQHEGLTKALFMARESLIAVLMKANGFESNIDNVIDDTISLTNTDEDESGAPIYYYTIKGDNESNNE